MVEPAFSFPAPPLLRCRDSFPDRVATIAASEVETVSADDTSTANGEKVQPHTA
jgi:hypothetical protein